MKGDLPSFSSVDQIQHWLLDALLAEGNAVAPRGDSTMELLGIGFKLSNPRARMMANRARRWSPALAVGEFAWHVSGCDKVAPIAYYAPRWLNFSDDGVHIRGSCYGNRIFSPTEGESQWTRMLTLLKSDLQTRRAILSVQQPADEALRPSSNDVPCVTSCQFVVRDGKVNAILHMRSNDVIWGLPYDVFFFTMIQEMLALSLNLDLGDYYHFAGSMHVYSRHFERAENILKSGETVGSSMPAMQHLDGLPTFLDAERELRVHGRTDKQLHPYWNDLIQPLRDHAEAVRS